MAFNVIVKNYEHFNRSLGGWDSPRGKYISSKRQYLNEMARQGMISYDDSKEMVKRNKDRMDKQDYSGLSDKAKNLIQSVHKRKDGTINLSDRQIDTLKEMGCKIDKKSSTWVTSYDRKHGGFANE